MHGTEKQLTLVVVRTCSFADWLFHAITLEWKDLSKMHELKTEKSLRKPPMYLIFSVEMTDVAARVVTDKQTDAHTPEHAHRGLISAQKE